jgi:hypothetical protein
VFTDCVQRCALSTANHHSNSLSFFIVMVSKLGFELKNSIGLTNFVGKKKLLNRGWPKLHVSRDIKEHKFIYYYDIIIIFFFSVK